MNDILVCTSADAFTSELISAFNQTLTQSGIKLTPLPQPKAFEPTLLWQVDRTECLAKMSVLEQLCEKYYVDFNVVSSSIFQTPKKLVVFDMDSTLITAEVIDEMAARHGVGEQVKAITKRAMNGELDFDASLKERVKLLKGFSRSHMESIIQGLRFTAGTEKFLEILRRRGIKTAIASGGFHYFASYVKTTLHMDYAFSNELDFLGDHLSGEVKGTIVNAQRKEVILQDLAHENKLTLNQVVAVGDGANDIPMLLKAGLGIAVHAKEKVRKTAHYRLQHGPMTCALSLMGEWEQA